MHLSFLNSNWYRRYPFRKSATTIDANGSVLPTDLIVGCRVTTDFAHKDVYISKVFTSNGQISIEFSGNSHVLGTAQGTITNSNQAIPIIPVINNFAGYVIVGNLDTTQNIANYTFTSSTGLLEASTITIFTPPAITSLIHNGQKMTGKAVFQVTGLVLGVDGQVIGLTVLAPSDVASRVDQTSALLTCSNPIISGINSVTPSPNGSGNNIDIYGISPVTISIVDGVIQVGTIGLTLADVCQPVNIPPLDTTETYGDITTATVTEWSTWPQYNS